MFETFSLDSLAFHAAVIAPAFADQALPSPFGVTQEPKSRSLVTIPYATCPAANPEDHAH